MNLASPILLRPPMPMRFIITVHQRTCVTRSATGDFVLIVEETLDETIVGVHMVNEEGAGDRTFVRIPMRWMENRSDRFQRTLEESKRDETSIGSNQEIRTS